MTRRIEMADREALIFAPAWVHCSCTSKIDEKHAEESVYFESYKKLTVDPDGERNIFCRDQPFLFSDDCRPYINIEPFSHCESPHYGEAVQNLVNYTENKKRLMMKKGASEADLLKIEEELKILNNALSIFWDQSNLKANKRYPCILQVLDRWFNTEKNITFDTYFTRWREVKELLSQIEYAFYKTVRMTKKVLKNAEPNVYERLGEAFSELCFSMEDLRIYKNGKVSFSYKGFERFDKKWNRKTSLSWLDERIDELEVNLRSCIEIIYNEVALIDNVFTMKEDIEEIVKVLNKFCEEVKKLSDDEEFDISVKNLKSKLRELDIDEWEVDEKEYLTKKSFLICRCGGIIKIMFTTQEGRSGLEKTYINLIEMLKMIQDDLYDQLIQCLENSEEPTYQDMCSFADGFNFLQYILTELGELSKYDFGIEVLIEKEGNRKTDHFGVEMNICIQSMSLIEKKKHYEKAENDIVNMVVSEVIGLLNMPGTVLSFVMSVSGFLKEQNKRKAMDVTVSSTQLMKDGVIKRTGEVVSRLLFVKDFAEVVGNLSYKTTADYVGEIQILMKIGTHDITYIRNYDIHGNVIDTKIKTVKRMREKKRSIGNHELPSAWVPDIRSFENKIEMEYAIIVDGEKLEGSKSWPKEGTITECLQEE